jgi:hypothetical protein
VECEFKLRESNGRDRVDSEKRWRGCCIVADYGSFSERASKRGDDGTATALNTPPNTFRKT